MDFKRLAFVGVLGALVMSLIMGIGQAFGGWPFSLEMTLGSVITRKSGFGTWALGFVWHLINGAVFAIFYSTIFKLIGEYGVGLGALIGFGHWVVDGFLFQAIQTFVPLPAGFPVSVDPFFWTTQGSGTFIVSLAMHLAFGAVVGGLYRPKVPMEPKSNIPNFHDTTRVA